MPHDPFYCSAYWRRLRAQKLAADPICETCKRRAATDVDHKKAINQGGEALEWDNLESLCHECHSRKTYYIERLGREVVTIKETDPRTGLPKDPNHWWNRGA